ncbi:Uncharacterised protein [uncultured archaeon]|nr:Uncharacterised protein [uncultured archaeon]
MRGPFVHNYIVEVEKRGQQRQEREKNYDPYNILPDEWKQPR